MNLPVTTQFLQFLCSVVLGICLALLWSLLRALRTARPKLVHLCDGVFVLALLPTLLLFALYVGNGRFRLFFFPGITLGCVLFFLLFGSIAHRIFLIWFRTLYTILHLPRKISGKFAKKLFPFAKK